MDFLRIFNAPFWLTLSCSAFAMFVPESPIVSRLLLVAYYAPPKKDRFRQDLS